MPTEPPVLVSTPALRMGVGPEEGPHRQTVRVRMGNATAGCPSALPSRGFSLQVWGPE